MTFTFKNMYDIFQVSVSLYKSKNTVYIPKKITFKNTTPIMSFFLFHMYVLFRNENRFYSKYLDDLLEDEERKEARNEFGLDSKFYLVFVEGTSSKKNFSE